MIHHYLSNSWQVEGRISAFCLAVKKSCVVHIASYFGLKIGSGGVAMQLIETREYIYPVQGLQVSYPMLFH